MVKNRALLIGLVLLGLLVLVGDLYGDMAFFSEPDSRRPELVGTAILRNLLTLSGIVALFFARRVAAYLLVLVGLLGAVRRWLFLSPILQAANSSDILILISGFDVPFRMLILGVGIGLLMGRESKE